MSRMQWFCLWHGTASDPKFRLAANRTGRSVADVVAVWIAILEHASAADDRGRVGDLDAELVGLTLELEPETVEAIVGAMTALGLLEGDRVARWDERQNIRIDPTNADRQKRHRESRNVTKRYVTTQDRTRHDKTYKTKQEKSCVIENGEHDCTDGSTANDSGQESLARQEATIADLGLGAEAIAICQHARPGADPNDLLRKFRAWGHGKSAVNWQKSLKTFAIKEWLADDEIRAEQRAIHNQVGPRLPGESAGEYQSRTADPPIASNVLAAMCALQR